MSKTSQIKAGAILTYVRLVISILIGIFYTPVMIRMLGKGEYGLYQTVASITSMMSILNLGFGSGYQRYYARYKQEGDREKIFRLNGMFMSIFLVIAAIAAACGVVLSFNLELIFKTGLTANEYAIATVLFRILLVQLVISFPMSVFMTIVQAQERFIFAKVLNTVKLILCPMLTLPLLLLGFRSIAMVSVSLTVSIIADIICIYYVFVVLKEKFRFGKTDKAIYKELFTYTAFIALHLITDQINWNLDKVILGRFRGTEEVALYSIGYSLYSYLLMIGTPIATLFIPRVHQLFSSLKDDITALSKSMTDVFIKVGRIQCLIVGCIVSGMVIFGRQFINIWVGDGYGVSYWVLVLLIVPGSLDLIQGIGVEIQRAMNLHKFRAIVYIITALANAVLSIPMSKAFGAVGATVGTALSFILVQGLVINIYYSSKCKLDIFRYWKNILSITKGLIIPVILGVIMSVFIDMTNVFVFIGCVVAYSIVYLVSMWFLGMDTSEKNMLYGILRKLHLIKSKSFKE